MLLSCSGLPAGAACGFSNSPVNLTNFNQPQTVTVTISTGQVAMLRHRSNPLVPEATLALALCFLGFRKRRGIQILLLAVISVLGVSMLSGCGSSGPGTIHLDGHRHGHGWLALEQDDGLGDDESLADPSS